jgi:CRP/FNR family transcriptional regulator, cyclic AMP receptor protein
MPPTAKPDDAAALIQALPAGLQALAARGLVRSYRKGTLIIEEGTHGDTLYVVLKGQVKAFSSDASGREITYGVHGAGDTFGEMSLDGGPRSASVQATTAATCAVLTRQSLREHIAAHPDFALDLIARVIQRARLATSSARNMALLDVYGRVVQWIASKANLQNDGTSVVNDRPTHADLAASVGCSREMVSRLLKDLERGGYIVVDGMRWVILRKLPARW